MDYNKIKGNNQVSIDGLTPEFLFSTGANKLIDSIPNMNYMNMPMLMQVRESATELLAKINAFASNMPDELKEAYGYVDVNLEETNGMSRTQKQ